MKDIDIARYEIINYLTEQGLNFQIHIFEDNFRIELIPSISIVCAQINEIVFKYSTQNPNDVQVDFEEQFKNVKDLLTYLKYYYLSKNDSFLSNEFLITNFLKYNLGIEKYFIMRVDNTDFDGIRYLHITFDKNDHIQISIFEDAFEIRNFGKASEMESGFYTVDPILVTPKIDEVLLYLRDTFESS